MIHATHHIHDGYLDLNLLQEYSSLKVSTLRHHIKHNHLPCFKVRGKILVKKNEFDRWIEQFRVNDDADLHEIADDVIKGLK